MGVVFKAFDKALHRMVAIKVLAPRLASSQGARRRFIREARAAAAINHPNVITIHSVSVQQEMPYLVMEYIAGTTLHHRIRQGPPLETEEVLRIAVQVASGLAAAHEQGVIHRDIKPANIMLENGVERVKIADFGLALAAIDSSAITSTGQMVGTPAYMSPEQVTSAGDIDSRSDLFSLGCVIYAMFAGHSPFKGKHTLEVIRLVSDAQPPPLHEACPRVPRALSEVVHRLLEKDPEGRFQTASEARRRAQAAARDGQRGAVGGGRPSPRRGPAARPGPGRRGSSRRRPCSGWPPPWSSGRGGMRPPRATRPGRSSRPARRRRPRHRPRRSRPAPGPASSRSAAHRRPPSGPSARRSTRPGPAPRSGSSTTRRTPRPSRSTTRPATAT